MIIVNDVRHLCGNKDDDRQRSETGIEVVHRISMRFASEPVPDKLLTGVDVADWYRSRDPKSPGGHVGYAMPYCGLIRRDGVLDLCRDLGDHTPHAARFNASGRGWAFAGDFRSKPPTSNQAHVAEQLFGLLIAAFGTDIHTHTELAGDGGSEDPSKQCPGRWFPITQIAYSASELASTLSRGDALEALIGLGLIG